MSGEGLERTVVLPEIPIWDEDKFLAQLTRYFQQLNYHTAFAYDEVGKHLNELPVMVPLAFFQDNVAADQSTVALSDGRSTRGICAPEDGSIAAVVVRTNAARTVGTLTIEARINGIATGLTAALNATDTIFAQSRQDPGLDVFTYGDAIQAYITTSADWEPVTADIIVSVGVIFSKGMR